MVFSFQVLGQIFCMIFVSCMHATICVCFLPSPQMIPVMSVKITNYEALLCVDYSPLTVGSSVTASVIRSALFSPSVCFISPPL